MVRERVPDRLVVDEPGPVRRFGFAYGTLPDHVESGEERFVVEWDEASGEVWYDILAFSRLRHPLVRIGNPYVRRMQKRFGKESAAAMQRTVRDERDSIPCTRRAAGRGTPGWEPTRWDDLGMIRALNKNRRSATN